MPDIERGRLLDLLVAEEKLNRLEMAGVDNWLGYHDALHDSPQTLEEFEIIAREEAWET